ncbi:DUF6252 family protein [Flavobacterium humi]|uniref:Uncharacterized protein n=1 Tax=Flavobacterium humi TaxID=2562683 RepID=A0A4Z0L594_9FLAO|nr:DUF6252 family protein [Flavobacterium humi]TGD57661.1 hypothetical protein E4635_10765 [Flavobacterium humi]
MKKIILFLILGVAFQSCQKEVEDSTPAFQARLNNNFWKATILSASKDASGGLTFVADSPLGSIVLKTNSSSAGTYTLGTTNQLNRATCTLLTDPTKNYQTGITQSAVNSVKITSGGTGYLPASLVATNVLTGSGSGLKVNITGVSTTIGSVNKVEVNVPGNGYKAGDNVRITGGDNNANLTVLNVANSNGEVIITKYDGLTVTGTFKFTAFDAPSGKTVWCRDGIFYKVPIN